MEMNELKPKKKAESQKLEKELQTNLTKAVKTITNKLAIESEVLTKKIEKWSKKLSKKIVKEVKANQPVTTENGPVVKVAVKPKPVVNEQLVAKTTPATKKKAVAAAVK